MQAARDAGAANSAQMERVARAVASMLSELNISGITEFLDDNIILELPFAPPPMPTRVEGRDAVMQALAALAQVFSAYHFTPQQLYPSPETSTLVMEADVDGKMAAGPAYQNRYVVVFAFNGGRIAGWREYFNPMKFNTGSAVS